MSQKLALKRLTSSDLTLFKWHYQNRPAGNQKAFNLDTRVLVDEFYPLLGIPAKIPEPRFPLDLYVIGPGSAPANNLQRKILKQIKNWRLNGELIDNPVDDPERYNILEVGDFALMAFIGDPVPTGATVALVARNHPDDAQIHAALQLQFPVGSMSSFASSQLETVLHAIGLNRSHLLWDLVDSEFSEDAVLGGIAGIDAVTKRRPGRGLSPKEFADRLEAAARTGVVGEELVNALLAEKTNTGELEAYEWSASLNAIAPFDFRLKERSLGWRLIDVKSTAGRFENPVHISLNEMRQAVNGLEPYDIYRVYQLADRSARLRISHDVGPRLAPLLAACESLPMAASVDAISLSPTLLTFEPEVALIL